MVFEGINRIVLYTLKGKNIPTILLVFLFFNGFSSLYAQNSVSSEGVGQKWVNFNDADVSGNQITIEAIIRRPFTNNGNIVSKHDGTNDCNYLFRPNSFQISTTDGFQFVLNPITLPNNAWFHIAGSYDGTSIKYYVDGCLVNEVAHSGDLITNNWDAAIGNRSNWPNGPEHFRGKIDEVRIWNEARTESEIRLNINTILDPASEAQLVAYYKFDGDYINQQGNAAFNGSYVGTPSFDLSPPVFIPFTIVTIDQTDISCFGSEDGSISIVATGNNVEYSIDGASFSSSPNFTNLPAGTYNVQVRSGNCEETVEVILIEPDQIPIPDIVVNAPICSTEDLSLFTSPVANASYFWNGPNGFTSFVNDTTITDLELVDSGIYSIYLEVDGCYSDTTSSEIIVNETYDILIVDTICANETFSFGPDDLNESGIYIQNLQSAAGCDSIVQLELTVNPSYSFTIDTSLCEGETIAFEGVTMSSTGTYPFNLFTTLGCDSIITYELIVYPIPDAPSVLSNSPLSCPGDLFEVSTASVAEGLYDWVGPNNYSFDESDFSFEAYPSNMGTYTVSVTVDGCISPITTINLEIVNIYSFEESDLPNVFTPNGNSANEVFDLQAYFKTCETYEVFYFDRWGNVVYRHTQNETPFSGNAFDGSQLMDGVYMYKIILENSEKQGYVHLIR